MTDHDRADAPAQTTERAEQAGHDAEPQAADGTQHPTEPQDGPGPATSNGQAAGHEQPVAQVADQEHQPAPVAATADQAEPGEAHGHQAEPVAARGDQVEPVVARGDQVEPVSAQAEPVGEPVEAAGPDAEQAHPLVPTAPAHPGEPVATHPAEQEHRAVPGATLAPQSAEQNPGRWGRVDAEGTVFVHTDDGERAVGSWQAGEPAEGLAHFARRFDDLRTEAELLHSRLAAGTGDPKHALTSAKHLRDSLAEAAVVGDLAGLRARIDYVIARAESAVQAGRHARDAARAESVARKQTLVEEAERIAEEATQWKTAGDRLREILDEWKGIKGLDRKTDEQLWKRFAKARDTFNRRRGSHFADLDRTRATAKARKQELVEEAEELVNSDDWGPTATRYKQLMVEWKAAGRAPKDADDALWQRFRAAQDAFFARRSSVFDERDAEFTENAKRKEELLAEAEAIDPADGLEAARAALHRIQDQWEQVGKVPRERVREFEGKLRTIEERVRSAGEAQWRRSDPEAEARAAQFRERVEQFEAQAAKARAAGDRRRAEQAESQAAQWREWLAAAEQAVASR